MSVERWLMPSGRVATIAPDQPESAVEVLRETLRGMGGVQVEPTFGATDSTAPHEDAPAAVAAANVGETKTITEEAGLTVNETGPEHFARPQGLTDEVAWQAWAADVTLAGIAPTEPPYVPDWACVATVEENENDGCAVVFRGRPHTFGRITAHVVCEIFAWENAFEGPFLNVVATGSGVDVACLTAGGLEFREMSGVGVDLGRAIAAASRELEDIQRQASRQRVATMVDDAVSLEVKAMIADREMNDDEAADALDMSKPLLRSRLSGFSHWRLDELRKIADGFGADPAETLQRLSGLITLAVR
ncbi:hypothetical protein [Microbacterium capsulatum]|uniref:HTH cro/C1-type domain-containing protein n=1 Tax=Microbacterium capsulatum TaxID=3041921 RepID=A0ABU0XF86_9MICO|nr:hypothetical protein [Microbacterium sp. ASV81]MDQ4213782.1 hypothetical protein [Microbacterium sp. ASV81]